MAKYIGTKCIVCGEVFKDGDDVVVCPDCGTPYHRDCWKIENKCVNDELHEKGASWQPEYPDADEPQISGEPLRCIRCGAENEAGKMFCGQCGMPLTTGRGEERPFNQQMNGADTKQNNGYQNYNIPPQQGYDQNPFGQGGQGGPNGQGNGGNPNMQYGPFGMPVQPVKLTEDSDIDGIRLGDFFEYVGRKSMSIIANFVKFAKTGAKTSLNFAAFLFPEYYFFYRKMNKQGVIYLILSFLLSIPSLLYYGQEGYMGMVMFSTPYDFESSAFLMLINVCSLISMAVSILAGFYANYWYYRQAREDIQIIRENQNLTPQDAKALIQSTGGTSWLGVLVSITISVVLSLAFWLIMSFIY